jgi:hypothetical protein
MFLHGVDNNFEITDDLAFVHSIHGSTLAKISSKNLRKLFLNIIFDGNS